MTKEHEGFDLSGLSDSELAILLPGLQAFTFPSSRIVLKTGKQVPITVSNLAAYSASLDQRGHGHLESGVERGHLLGGSVSSDIRQAALGLFWLPTPEYPAGRIEVGSEAMANPPLAVEVMIAEAAHAIDYGALTGKQRAKINRLFTPIEHQHAPDEREEIGPDDWFEGHDADYWAWPGERWMSLCMAAYAPDLPRPLEASQPWTHSYDESDIQAVRNICSEDPCEEQTQPDQSQPTPGDIPMTENDQSTQDPQAQPDAAQVSQETPQQDSGLQTPQADQPVPTETERDGQGQQTQPEQTQAEAPADSGLRQEDESAPEPPQAVSNEDQAAAAAQKEQELEAARREHAARTGGGEVREGELEAARNEHNERTGGGNATGQESQGE